MKAARRSAFKARLRWPCLNTGSPGGLPCLRSSWPGDPGPGPGDTGPGFKGPETGGGPGAARGEVGARGGRVVLSRRPDTETARSGFTAVCRGIRPCCQSLGTRHSNTAWEKMGCWGGSKLVSQDPQLPQSIETSLHQPLCPIKESKIGIRSRILICRSRDFQESIHCSGKIDHVPQRDTQKDDVCKIRNSRGWVDESHS